MVESIFFILLSLCCLYGVFYFYRQGIKLIHSYIRITHSKKWNTTKGKVIDAEYKFLKYTERTANNSYYTRIDFVINKTYTYSVNSKAYTSNQGKASDSLWWRKFKSLDKLPKKKNIVVFVEDPKTKQLENEASTISLYLLHKNKLQERAKSTIGEEVLVYYNPNNPSKSCLSIETELIAALSALVMLIFGTMSAYMCYFIAKDFLAQAIITVINNL